jgi:uncharacterized protein
MSISGDAVLAGLGGDVPAPPTEPWVMRQTWRDLLFAHWPVPVQTMAALLPAGLSPDIHNGTAWVGVVPFVMTGVRPRGIPSVPPLSNFPEINVRTYVTVGGKPGVYFFSLDAGNAIAVWLARTFFSLPYFTASFTVHASEDAIIYASERHGGSGAGFGGRYWPIGTPFQARPGTREYFLVERYCLYTTDRQGKILRGEIRHAPWQLQVAEAEIRHESLTAAAQIPIPNMPPLLHFAKVQEVVAWPVRHV